MLRGFLLIFVLAGIVIVAMCGFRGEHSPRTPWEIFPDMVRQQKVRAQSPIDFFGDGRGPRLPIANTIPIDYEMPKSQMKTLPAGAFGVIPAGMHHYAKANGETVLQLHGIGPWRLIYVNKADDPRKKVAAN